MITFGANLINKTNIQKYNVNKGYSEYSAYMIKLDPESQSDRFALSEINKSWKNSTTFADCIDNAFKLKHIGSFEYKNTEFFIFNAALVPCAENHFAAFVIKSTASFNVAFQIAVNNFIFIPQFVFAVSEIGGKNGSFIFPFAVKTDIQPNRFNTKRYNHYAE